MSDSSASLYPYAPNKGAPVVFCVVFAVSTVLHIYQNIKTKTWLVNGLLPWAGALFVVGFAMREVSVYHSSNLGIYIASAVLLLLAPPVYAAANYFILGRTLYYVPYLSPIHPGRVVSTFIGLDAVVGILTGQGASRISNFKDPDQVRIGSAIIKASLLLQIGLCCGFIALQISFHLRCVKANVFSGNLRVIMVLLYISNALILIRHIFRTLETFQGYNGYLQTHEAFFYVFDGLLVLINSLMLNIWHPSRFLPRSNKIYLSRDGVTELEGPGWVEKRPFIVTLLDPFDIVGLIKGRDKASAFWEAEEATTHGDVTVISSTELGKRPEGSTRC